MNYVFGEVQPSKIKKHRRKFSLLTVSLLTVLTIPLLIVIGVSATAEDTTKPEGSVSYHGGIVKDGVRYIKSIDDLTYTENITDNTGVVRATILVKKLNTSNNKYEVFCGNWNKNSLGSHDLGGSTSESYTGNVKTCRSNDNSPWPDGKYKIFHGAYDPAGNEGKYSDVINQFAIETNKPIGVATYQGGTKVGNIIYINSIDQLKYTEHIIDDQGVARSTVLVKKYNEASEQYEMFCGNWNKNSLGNHNFSGNNSEEFYTGNVKTCRSNDNSPWPDGKYQVFHGAYDLVGNEGKYNTTRQLFIIDSVKPNATATYSGGRVVGDLIYINNIDDLQYHEEITDNYGVVRATILVKKLNQNTGQFESFCGNWNKLSLGSHELGGSISESYSGDVKTCRSNDNSPWPDGKYRITHGAYDIAGNEVTYNNTRQQFVIDTAAPAQVSGMQIIQNNIALGCGPSVNQRQITVDWEDITDLDFVSYQYQADEDKINPIDFKASNIIASKRSGTIRDKDGTYNYRVRALDYAGNYGPWSEWCSATLDRELPAITLNGIENGASTTRLITGTAEPTSVVSVTVLSTPTTQNTIANVNGVWNLEFQNLEIGEHNVVATSTDTAGNQATEQTSFEVLAPTQAVAGVSTGTSNRRTASANSAPLATVSESNAGLLATSNNSNSGQQDKPTIISDSEQSSGSSGVLGSTKNVATQNLMVQECGKILGICWYYFIPPAVIAIVLVSYTIHATKRTEAS